MTRIFDKTGLSDRLALHLFVRTALNGELRRRRLDGKQAMDESVLGSRFVACRNGAIMPVNLRAALLYKAKLGACPNGAAGAPAGCW
jgi:hypothetical protein